MYILLLLQCQIISALSIGNSIRRFSLSWNNQKIHHPSAHQYIGSIEDVPIFVVESRHSSPVTLTIGTERVVPAFIDPKDATDFLAEIAQTESSDEFQCSSLRIRVMTLSQWFEKVDPSKERLTSRIKYKLVPSSTQNEPKNIYTPLRPRHDSSVPLFFSKRLVITSSSGQTLTPLFFDLNDLYDHTKVFKDPKQRELIMKSVEVLPLIDQLLLQYKLQGARNQSTGNVTLYPIRNLTFDGIRDIGFADDKATLEKYGIPLPPQVLNVAVKSNRMGIYNLIKHVLVSYEETLVDAVSSVKNDKFEKRKTMFIKLIAAVTIRWYTMYRWKTYDRLLLKPLNLEEYERTKSNRERARENLHVYQVLWQEHCYTMKRLATINFLTVPSRLLEEWNEATDIFDKYKLQDSLSTNCEMTDVMDRLNELMYGVTEVHNGTDTVLEKQTLKTILKESQYVALNTDDPNVESLEVLKRQKINEFQTMVNVGIKNFEDTLVSLSVQLNNLTQFSRMLSKKLFIKKPTMEYIKQLKVENIASIFKMCRICPLTPS
ncbi:apicoplast TIC22, putative [Babesia ovis]|uniref:Apicoplast TIC22, putative n=1 Tax=Babesia ovis TaxID=5869 RepID=A0A9W5TCF7_BABOV|nr:apicoplast TIC22, putative [Babesia ovis]